MCFEDDKYPEYDSPEITDKYKALLPHPHILIPDNIKYLIVDCPSRYYTNLQLSSNLEYLKLYIKASMVCENVLDYIKLPASLKYLYLTGFFSSKISSKMNYNNLPQSLEELVICSRLINNFTVYPPNLKRLYLFGGCSDTYRKNLKKMQELIHFDIYELNYPDFLPTLLELF